MAAGGKHGETEGGRGRMKDNKSHLHAAEQQHGDGLKKNKQTDKQRKPQTDYILTNHRTRHKLYSLQFEEQLLLLTESVLAHAQRWTGSVRYAREK